MSYQLKWTWYFIAEFIHGPQPIQEMLIKYPWTKDFLLPIRPSLSYESSTREFNINSVQTIIVLQRFAKKLMYQEIAIHLCKTSEHLPTFNQICKAIVQRIDQARVDATTNAGYQSVPGTSGSTSHAPIAVSDPSRKDVSSVPDEVLAALKQHDQTYGHLCTEIGSADILDVVSGILGGEYKLGNDNFEKEVSSIGFDITLAFETQHFDQPLQSLKEVSRSQLMINFAENLTSFTCHLTGTDGREWDQRNQVSDLFNRMGETNAARSQQFNPIHAEVQQLRSIVDKQNQIITSLEYRRLLENLPNKVHYDQALNITGARANAYWKAAWKDIVKEEIQHMILAKTTPTSQKRPLTELFRYDFDIWWQANTKLQKNTTLQKVPQQVPQQVPEKTFQAWPAYARGKALYGELSSNIHQYDTKSGEPYDVKPSNWSRSDRLILAVIRPDKKHIIIDQEGIMDVNWVQERTRHGLK